MPAEPGRRRKTWNFAPLSELRPALVLLLDGVISAGCLWLAMLLRFEGNISGSYRDTLPIFVILLVGFRVLASMLFRLHRWSFRFSGLADGARVAMAGLAGTGLFLATMYLTRHPGPPRSVVVLELLLSTLFMALVRFSPRLAGLYISDWTRSRREGSLRTLIVGAGAAGEMLLRDLQRSADHRYHVIGFVDDDRSKRNHVVGGRTVLGGIDDLPELVRAYRAAQVLIAIPRLEGRRVREILSLCADLKLRFKILPVSFIYLQRAAGAMMQDLSPEDLLPRDPVTFSSGDDGFIRERTALVTGAAGSIGSEVCTQLVRAGLRKLIMVDVNENGLYIAQRGFERRFPESEVVVQVADIRDRHRMQSLFERYRPLDVFHAAAHKHVPLMEAAPCEAIKNNVAGTRHVAQAAHQAGAERFVYVSTDKAVRPTSVMGASKRVGEEIVRSMARRSRTKFCAVRFGNVLGSAGSVVPLFQQQIAGGGPVSVTHPEVRRYFMTVSEAVALVLSVAYGDYGELCVLDMGEQLKIVDLARHMITMAGLIPDVDIPIAFTGLRPGEKLYEELLTEEEEQTRRVSDKIFAAECPPPVDDLEHRVAELERAAEKEMAARVSELLRQMVPSYVQRPAETAEGGQIDAAHASARPA